MQIYLRHRRLLFLIQIAFWPGSRSAICSGGDGTGGAGCSIASRCTIGCPPLPAAEEEDPEATFIAGGTETRRLGANLHPVVLVWSVPALIPSWQRRQA